MMFRVHEHIFATKNLCIRIRKICFSNEVLCKCLPKHVGSSYLFCLSLMIISGVIVELLGLPGYEVFAEVQPSAIDES